MNHGLPLKLEGVRGTCTRVPFKDKFSDFMIANIKIEDPEFPDIDGQTFSFKGNLFLKAGQPVYIQTASFDKKSDMKYGGTYLDAVLSYDIDFESASKSEVQKYLSFITSETLAKSIVDTLDNPIETISNADIDKLTSVPGIGEHTAQRIIEQHSNNKDYSLALSIIPSRYGITDNATREIVDYYGGNNELAIEQLEEDPYHVVNIPKFGFKTADEMFLKANENDANKHTDPRRVRAYIDYMFDSYYMDGAAWMSDDELIHNLGVNIPGFNAKYVTEYLKDKDRFIIIPTKNGDSKSSRIASVKYATVEMKIANRLIEMVNKKDTREYENVEEIIEEVETQQGFDFDDDQRGAIYSMLSSNVLLLQGLAGSGKAQPNDTMIPVPEGGFKRMGDIKVGDYVFDRLGNPTKVIGVYPQGELDNYKVTLSDGRETYCNDEHLWSTFTSKGNVKVRTVREMLDMGLYHGKSGKKNSKFRIQTHKCVEYSNDLDPHLDPYAMGVLLGDGSFRSTSVTISSDDVYVVEKFTKLIGAYSYYKNHETNYNYYFRTENPEITNRGNLSCIQYSDILGEEETYLLDTYSHEKYIPDSYKYTSVENRYKLIQGLLDTDGSIGKNSRANVTYSTVSKRLAEDIQEVLYSLGYMSTMTTDYRDTYTQGVCYNLVINIPNSEKQKLFTLPRKLEIAKGVAEVAKNRNYDRIGIRYIEPTGEKVEMTCIQVDNDEELYLTNDFIVTHNTSVVNGAVKSFIRNGLRIGQSALSGRAASNLENVTGVTGQTIHRLLKYGTQKPYNKNNKLPHDVIIIDEISMVSNDIFLQLIEAMKDDAKLIMVGDLGQLPSIGVGPAKGIVNSNIVPSITLKNIHRQAKESAIITHSIAFRHGEKPEDFDFKNRAYGAKEDLKYMFVHKDAEPKIEGLAIEVFKQKIEQYKVNDIAIITSTRKFVYNLNVMAQRIANPPSPSKKEFVVNEAKNNEYTLRVGDKVMNVRNNYNTVNIHDELQPIFNGNTGVILDIVESDKSMVAIIEFDGVDTVKVPLSKFGSPIELGYSMTVHKCVTGDTLINTNKGIMRIRDLDNGAGVGEFKEIEGDLLISNGEYYEKPSHFYNNGVDTVRHLTTYKGYGLKATKQHGIDVFRDGKVDRVDVEDLRIGDSLVIQLGSDNVNKYQAIPNEWYNYELYHNSIVTPKKPKVVDEKFAKFLGYMVGDGTVTKNGLGIKLSKKNKEVTQEFYDLVVELFGYTKENPIKFRKSGDYMCEINSADINRFCLNIDGIQAHNKFVPDIIMKSPESVQVAFLSGIFEDGWASEKEGTFDHIGISLMDEKAIRQIQLMLLNLGVITTMRKRTTQDKKYNVERYVYSLNIFKYDCRTMLEKGFSFRSEYKQETLLKCLIDSKYSRKTSHKIIDHPEYGLLFIDEITNITEHEEQTYCLTMPETHKFIQNGIHAYNSQGDTIKEVIVALPYQYMLNTRELLYTAITRAADECFIITSPRTLKATYKKSSDQVQRSNLQLFLQYNDIMNEKYFK